MEEAEKEMIDTNSTGIESINYARSGRKQELMPVSVIYNKRML